VSMGTDRILPRVTEYYASRLRDHGPTPRGVDWNSAESQHLRFEQLLKVCEPSASVSINDYGCGYGALVDYLASRGAPFTYLGYDASEAMIAQASALHAGRPGCVFVAQESELPVADYSVASGIFNVKLQFSDAEWTTYMLHLVDRLAALSRRGFAFNALTSYADADRMRADLYYADPLFWFDRCKRRYARRVALLHDYPLYEFTILVRL